MNDVKKGTSYLINNNWYEVVWFGFKYAYCKSYNQDTKKTTKHLLKITDLKKGLYCPF